MTTKTKPTPKQLAARKKFTQMAKDGTLAKKRKAAAEKSGLNSSLPKGMTKVIAKNIKITGLSKTTGRILKGYKYEKGGKIVKVKPKK
jgi:hypothetical protein